jgi:putative transposase
LIASRFMFSILIPLLSSIIFSLRTRRELQIEIVALRHQISVLRRSVPSRPRLRTWDRVLWVWLSHIWPNWRSALVIVKPEIVIAWHRKGFRLFWTWKSMRRCAGRPKTSREIRELIRKISKENPLWGAPRIHGELLKLGISISRRPLPNTWCDKPNHPLRCGERFWKTIARNSSPSISLLYRRLHSAFSMSSLFWVMIGGRCFTST